MDTVETQEQHPRHAQIFPVLEVADIERLRRFGEPRPYDAGTCIFGTGELSPGLLMLLMGTIEITRNEGIGGRSTIITHGPGQFAGEPAQLSDRPSLVNATAVEPDEAQVVAAIHSRFARPGVRSAV